MNDWHFTAQIDEEGDLLLEWYKGKGNVVTVCFNAAAGNINWAALVDGVSHHGSTPSNPEGKQT